MVEATCTSRGRRSLYSKGNGRSDGQEGTREADRPLRRWASPPAGGVSESAGTDAQVAPPSRRILRPRGDRPLRRFGDELAQPHTLFDGCLLYTSPSPRD